MRRSFAQTAYSDNHSLDVFLRTLSYHQVGARYFASQIASARTVALSMLDVGCGNGVFTAALLARLRELHVTVEKIIGVDPDADNLSAFEQRLNSLGSIVVQTEITTIQQMRGLGEIYDLVLLSHSLYGFMEDPAVGVKDIDTTMKLLYRHLAPKGLLLISMASRESPAYEYKRQVLANRGDADRSAFGEDVAAILDRLSMPYTSKTVDSYMDMTGLMRGPALDLQLWTKYFCRIPDSQVHSLECRMLQDVLSGLVVPFASLSEERQAECTANPATSGPPSGETLILPHRECFLTVPARQVPAEA